MTDVQRPRLDPVEGNWCDDDRCFDDVIAQLRVPPTDADADRIKVCVATACQLITVELDRGDVPVEGDPPALRTAHAMVAVELYRRKDAPFGVLNAWSPDELATRISIDPLAGVLRIIFPWKMHWGLG